MHPDSNYKSIPLSQFISENEVMLININNLGRVLHLTMKNGNEVEIYYGMKIDKIPHVGFLLGHSDHIYYKSFFGHNLLLSFISCQIDFLGRLFVAGTVVLTLL
jgi:hypothetical protein